MARPDLFYVYEWFNDALDSDPHYGIMQLDADAKPKKYLEMLLMHNDKLRIDTMQKLLAFNSRSEAQAKADELGNLADAVNPDRVGADKQFPPGEANRALEVGMDKGAG